MSELEFFNTLGFDANPFQFTNADEEERLAEYFVPPPYFHSVWGNPKKPSSTVVFAPRGGGKSAQRRMIEIEAAKANILAITYDRFEFKPTDKVEQISLRYHLDNLIKRVLLGELCVIHERGMSDMNFYPAEKEFIHKTAQTYLGHLTQPQLVEALRSLRSVSDRLKTLIQRFATPITSLVNVVLKSQGIPAVNFQPAPAAPTALDESAKYNLETLGQIAARIGFDSIYVLIDKADETELTSNDSSASYSLVAPLLKDLELLALQNFAFKFFLWDEIEPYYRSHARPDRVPQFVLEWDHRKINEALGNRLKAFSHGVIGSLGEITVQEYADLINNLVLFFANNSPRDIIRLCQDICSSQMEIEPASRKLTGAAIIRGINVYSEKRVKELIDKDKLRELKKLKRLDFTISYVAGDVFKITQPAAISKIKSWVKSGLVKKVGEKTVAKSRRPVYHYAVVDARLARYIFEDLSLFDFVIRKIGRCPECDSIVYRDWDLVNEHTCQVCGNSFKK